MKKKNLILNALILTFSTMTLGFIGMSFRVYLSNQIGAEGMGLFQLLMSINIFTSTLCISGIRVTTTRLVAEELGRGNYQKIKTIIKKGCIYSLFFSILTALLVYYNAEYISVALVHDERAKIPLQILSCGLPFIGVCSCLNGYFYGMRKIFKSIAADILESSIMMLLIVLFIGSAKDRSLEYMCSLVTLSMSVSLIVSTAFSFMLYIFDKDLKHLSSNVKSKEYSLLKITKISFPIGCSAYIQTSLRTLEDILIPNALRAFGSSFSSSLATFGLIKGMVLPILGFPAIFLASFSTLIIPEIAEANALNNKKRVNYIISRVLKFTLIIALFATGMFMIYSKELGIAIYKDAHVGYFMRILAPLIPLMYLDRIVDGSLNALNQQMSTLRYNLADMILRISIIFFLIPKTGIEGFIIVIFVSTIFNSLLSINRLLKVTNIPFEIIDWVLKPCASVYLGCHGSKILFSFLGISNMLVTQILVAIVFYFILLIVFRSIKGKDLAWFIDGFRREIKNIDYKNVGIYKQI